MTYETDPAPERELTGGKVLAIMVALFGTIITVNFTMAYNAVSTFPGLVVKNSYVASQSFDAERAAQEALGLDFSLRHEAGTIEIGVTGAHTQVAEVSATIGRPTHARDDLALSLNKHGTGAWQAEADLASGVWVLRLSGSATDGTAFRKDLTLVVR